MIAVLAALFREVVIVHADKVATPFPGHPVD